MQLTAPQRWVLHRHITEVEYILYTYDTHTHIYIYIYLLYTRYTVYNDLSLSLSLYIYISIHIHCVRTTFPRLNIYTIYIPMTSSLICTTLLFGLGPAGHCQECFDQWLQHFPAIYDVKWMALQAMAGLAVNGVING